LWPLRREFYNQQDWSKRFHLFYANAYNYEYHCTCHLGATKRVWQEVTKLPEADKIGPNLQVILDKHLTRQHDSWQAWNLDEIYFTSLLKAWSGYPKECHMIERGGAPPSDRIDRSNWPSTVDTSGKTDAHIVRPGYTEENWPRLRPLIAQLLPQHLAWADEYVAQFRKAVTG
jgi:hypothetical protein